MNVVESVASLGERWQDSTAPQSNASCHWGVASLQRHSREPERRSGLCRRLAATAGTSHGFARPDPGETQERAELRRLLPVHLSNLRAAEQQSRLAGAQAMFPSKHSSLSWRLDRSARHTATQKTSQSEIDAVMYSPASVSVMSAGEIITYLDKKGCK